MSATGSGGSDQYLDTALDAARWIVSRDTLGDTTLYSGAPGPILFFLELYRYTSDAAWLDRALAAAHDLLTAIDDIASPGLYSGLAGIGFTLGVAFRVTGDRKYHDGVVRCVERISAIRQEDTDIYEGASGTGLFLLWAARELGIARARMLAIDLGHRLVDIAGDPAAARFPNFSHGTSGVAYFLATLAQTVQDDVFLRAAEQAASHLIAIANTADDGCVVHHDEDPDGRRLYYLGWCHGPAGTARLFYRLYKATRDQTWITWVKRCAQGIVAHGGPRRVVTPGDWNNVGVCCGVAGEGRFFLSVYVLTTLQRYLALAREASDLLLERATRDENGAHWVQAEHRTRPEQLDAQTGYMQGASGIGMWLLHMSAFERGRPQRPLVLPDNPFPY